MSLWTPYHSHIFRSPTGSSDLLFVVWCSASKYARYTPITRIPFTSEYRRADDSCRPYSRRYFDDFSKSSSIVPELAILLRCFSTTTSAATRPACGQSYAQIGAFGFGLNQRNNGSHAMHGFHNTVASVAGWPKLSSRVL